MLPTHPVCRICSDTDLLSRDARMALSLFSRFRFRHADLHSRWCAPLIIVAVLQGSSPAWADSSNAPDEAAPSKETASSEETPAADSIEAPASRRQQVQALKAKADSLFRAREYVAALAVYDEAYALLPDARLLYNKGRAFQALGRYGEALEALLQFERQASPELMEQVQGLQTLVDDLRQRVCELHVAVNVPGAEVTLGTEVLGTSPLPVALYVNAGQYRLRVEKDGYFGIERRVTLNGGGVASYEVSLETKAQHAKLIIQSRVPGASVQIDGRPIGQAPTEAVLPPGAHTILARRKDYTDASTQVVLEAGQLRTITLDPLEQPALYERWWFWGGVGVAAAAAVVTVLVVSSRTNSGTEGDFSPSAISAPLVAF